MTEIEYIEIDPVTRKILSPAGMLLGVMEDANVERKYFKCPKIVGDNVDLSAHQIYIKYTQSLDKNGEQFEDVVPGIYHCEDVSDEGDYITFSWKLSGNVCVEKGFIAFSVVASDGGEVRWNTYPAVGTVLLTIPGGLEEVAKRYPDIISQLLNRMDEVEAIATPEAMQEYVKAYFTENPPSGMTDEEREQLNKNTEDISSLSEEIASLELTVGGLTNEQREALIAIVNAIGVFSVANGQELVDNFNSAWEIVINATDITLNKTTLSFEAAVSQTLTATLTPENSTDEVVWSSSAESIATVQNGVVTPVSNGSCTITATAGSVSASCEVTVNVQSAIVTYTVANNLTNVSTDNPVTTITENSSYTAVLTPDTDYEFDTVTVTMGGVDVTSDVYANGTIIISAVTGNVIITAIAVDESTDGEVVILKSITGDGASYIDTEIAPESLFSTYGVDISVEMSAKIDGYENAINLFGANQSKLYGSYGAFCATSGTMYCRGINGDTTINAQDSNGFWNTTAVPNLYTEQRWYRYVATSSGALATVYMDESMSTLPSSSNADFTAFSNYDEGALRATVPIIPIYIFAVNVGTDANQIITDSTPTAYTLYYFKIKKYSTDELLHEFVPAMQGNKVGLYDTVTQKFHENKGTGYFAYEEVA